MIATKKTRCFTSVESGRTTLNSRSGCSQGSLKGNKRGFSVAFFQAASLVLAFFILSPGLLRAVPQAGLYQRDPSREDQYPTDQQEQQNVGTQQGTAPQSQNPEGVPTSTPTVVLDDGRGVTTQPTNETKQTEQNQNPLRAKPRAKTAELTDFQQMVATSLGQTLPIYGCQSL